jgi:hypothetical protein
MSLPHPPLIDKGVILTVGVVSGSDRTAVVMPLITDDAGLIAATRCTDAVAAFIAGPLATFAGILASNAYVAFVQAEGMIDGEVPARIDFAPAEWPGGQASVAMPNNVAGLTVFYGDPADLPGDAREPVGKTFWPAVPVGEVTGDIISPALHTSYSGLATTLKGGFATFAAGGLWYRVASKGGSRAAGTEGVGCISTATRNYVATQRRRLTPH